MKKRRKKKRKTKRTRSGVARRRQGGPMVQVVGALGPDDDCVCPICAELAEAGQTILTFDANGDPVERKPKEQPMMQVEIRVLPDLANCMRTDISSLRLPVGCIIEDMLAYLAFKNPRIEREFEAMEAYIDGEPSPMGRVLQPNERITVVGLRDAGQTAYFLPSLVTTQPS